MYGFENHLLGDVGRRAFLGGVAALSGLGLTAPALAREKSFAFPGSASLRALIEPALMALGRDAQVERLGFSAGGKPIDLVSIGAGERSALIVGAPHPNEPVGCLTVVSFISDLARDPEFRQQSGYRWHFIPAIDPDGLDLNGGWLGGPATLENYMRHFFRPAFARQPEYSFPFDMPGYRFDASTPENLCWQRALQIAKPDFQSSLHGSDTGGAFFILSNDRAGLAPRLTQLAERSSVGLNRIGEPDATILSYSPGVFAAFEVKALIDDALRAGKAPSEIWNAGRSSTEFATQTYGTFSMICEVPLWRDRRQDDTRLSSTTMGDIVALQVAQTKDNQRLLDRAQGLLNQDFGVDLESVLLAEALREAAAFAPSQLSQLQEQIAASDRTSLSFADVAVLDPGMGTMRTPAMVARLAKRHGAREIERTARSILDRLIDRYYRSARLRRVSTGDTISLQKRAILAALP